MVASQVAGPASETPQRGRWRWALAAPVIIASMLTVLAAATPGGNTPLIIAAVPAWLLAFCLWVTFLVIRRYRRSGWAYLLPLAGGLVFALVSSGTPLRVAFAMSEPALTTYAAALPEQEPWIFHEEQAGVFAIDQARRWNGITELRAKNSGGMLEQCGFAHVSAERVQELGTPQITHLTGDWYAVCIDFD
ncbi:hypothetical protein GCM10010156_76830 [Planobispora rosea]|uniref:Uncharacterized protein n=1 Tax=Planobispora rosea TaxID=35762 RepID=A0A8J3S8B8_PLARO|nr:hypothetical protein [Planobispora rosea]GGT08480.1 hypothetical protein GCM10010156_76830 [Planobispora rosea]GIH89198.1 hypothetical protein Pro02_76060 [Planobispora rosea]